MASNFTRDMRTFSCGMWDLVPQPGIKPKPPALGTWVLRHCTQKSPLSDTLSFLSVSIPSPPLHQFKPVLCLLAQRKDEVVMKVENNSPKIWLKKLSLLRR